MNKTSTLYEDIKEEVGAVFATPRQLSKIIGRSESMLAKDRMGSFGVPYLKLGSRATGMVRYRVDDIVAWIESHTVQTA